MKKTFKIALGALFLAAILIGSVYYLAQPKEIGLYTVEEGIAMTYFIEQGSVKSDDKIQIYSFVQGEVLSVHAEENQEVKKGDVIAVIDSSALESQKQLLQGEISGYSGQIRNLELLQQQEKDNLQITLKNLEGEYNSLLSRETDILNSKDEQVRLQNIVIDQSRSDLAYAQEELNRALVLYENDVISKSQLEEVENTVSAFSSALDSSLKQLDIIYAGEIGTGEDYLNNLKDSISEQIQTINVTLGKNYTAGMRSYYNALSENAQAQIAYIDKQIEDCVIKAPADGVITELSLKNANIVTSQYPAAVLSAKSHKEIEVYVSTRDIGDISLGDKVELTFKRQKGDLVFEGEISFIDSEAVLKYSSLGVEERRIKVLVTPEQMTEIELNTGYDVEVKFITYYEEDKITLPKTSVFLKDGKDTVFVIEKGRIEEREVILGAELRTEYVIEEGLLSGELVVKDANEEGLKEGVAVKVE